MDILRREPLVTLGAMAGSNRVLQILVEGERTRRLQRFFEERKDRILLTAEERIQMRNLCDVYEQTGTMTQWESTTTLKVTVSMYMAGLLCMGATALAYGNLGMARSFSMWYVDYVLCLLQGDSYKVFLDLHSIHIQELQQDDRRIDRVQFTPLEREGAADPDAVGFQAHVNYLRRAHLVDIPERDKWKNITPQETATSYWSDLRYYCQQETLPAPPCSPLQHEEARDALYAAFSPYAFLQDLGQQYFGPDRLEAELKWSVGRTQAVNKEVVGGLYWSGPVVGQGTPFPLYVSWPWRSAQPLVVDKAITRLDGELAEALRIQGGWRANREQLDVVARCWLGLSRRLPAHATQFDKAYAEPAQRVLESFCAGAEKRRLAQQPKTWPLWSSTPIPYAQKTGYAWDKYRTEKLRNDSPLKQPSLLHSLACVFYGDRVVSAAPLPPFDMLIALGAAAWQTVAVAGVNPLREEFRDYGLPESHPVFQDKSAIPWVLIPLQAVISNRYTVAHALLHHAPTAFAQSTWSSAENEIPGYTAIGLLLRHSLREPSTTMDFLDRPAYIPDFILLHVLLGAGHFDETEGEDQRTRKVAYPKARHSFGRNRGDYVLDLWHPEDAKMKDKPIHACMLALLVGLGDVDKVRYVGYFGILPSMQGYRQGGGQAMIDDIVNHSLRLVVRLILIRRYGGEKAYREDVDVNNGLETWYVALEDVIKAATRPQRDNTRRDRIGETLTSLIFYLKEEWSRSSRTAIHRLRDTLEKHYGKPKPPQADWNLSLNDALLATFPDLWSELPKVEDFGDPMEVPAGYLQELAFLVKYYHDHPMRDKVPTQPSIQTGED